MANKDTAEYSASKAPETRKQAEELETTFDSRLIPGGAHGTRAPQGMAAIDNDVAPEAPQTTDRETGRPESA